MDLIIPSNLNHSLLKILACAILGLIFLSSCNDDRFYERNIGISNGEWNVNDKKIFEVVIQDTLAQYDFYINVRNSGGYPYANLFLFLNTVFPNGEVARDTLELLLAEPSGKWLGKGSGDIYDNRIMFKKGAVFPMAGSYRFEFEHGMRTETLPHIMDIGLRIEKYDRK